MNKATLTIDDSGWGSLLGGVIIGMYNTGNNKYYTKLIPVSFFKGKKFTNQEYKLEATKIFLSGRVKIGDYDTIEICRGYALDGIYNFVLSTNNTKIIRKEIKDPLQSYLEEKFAQSLIKIGVPRKTNGAHCLSYEDQVKWVLENPKKRVKYVKEGWKSWKQKYSNVLKEKD